MQVLFYSSFLVFGAIIASEVEHPTLSMKVNQVNISESTSSAEMNGTIEPTTESEAQQTSTNSHKNSSNIYGESDAEQLGELSVIDILFKKRSVEDYDDDGTTTERTGYSPVVIEETEYSYEEISNNDQSPTSNSYSSNDQEIKVKDQSGLEMDELVPPATDAKQMYFN